MARKGYDDEGHLERVRAIMAEEPARSRRSAIRQVIGDNPSNIRRIEVKMARLGDEAADAPVAKMPDAVLADHAPARVVRADPEAEWAFLSMGALVALALTVTWVYGRPVLTWPTMAISWAELKAASLIAAPSPLREDALAAAWGALSGWTPSWKVTLKDVLSVRAAVGGTFLLAAVALCATALVVVRHRPGARWVAAGVLAGALMLPSVWEMWVACAAAVVWVRPTRDLGLPMRLAEALNAEDPLRSRRAP